MSELVRYEEFIPYIRPVVSTCPEVSMISALRLACREFCTATNAWQSELERIHTIANIATYEIDDIPAGARIGNVLGVTHNEIPLSPTTDDLMDEWNPSWRAQVAEQASHYLMHRKDIVTVTLYPMPNANKIDAINVRSSLIPTLNSSTVGEPLLSDHVEVIAAGALARLLSVPNKTWSAPQLANQHRMTFLMAVNDTNIAARKAFSEISLRVQPVRFI